MSSSTSYDKFPARDLTTVFEILNQSEEKRRKLSLNINVVFMDQALFAKACDITWKEECFSNIILRMGTCHTICNMCSILAEYTSVFLGQLRDMVQEEQKSQHSDLQRSCIKKYERAVSAVVVLRSSDNGEVS
ncbi:hypothetical protein OS493_033246 [Desmophyllum pertusum]|uniref:Uncharacterized protein n=1 Tax=Desmophyllum pertusum TaxID=174260 RepID=A0A9X0D710_9CNID|nr:hypothetical protein OS493_033246 [Desmophyllum pertusum]